MTLTDAWLDRNNSAVSKSFPSWSFFMPLPRGSPPSTSSPIFSSFYCWLLFSTSLNPSKRPFRNYSIRAAFCLSRLPVNIMIIFSLFYNQVAFHSSHFSLWKKNRLLQSTYLLPFNEYQLCSGCNSCWSSYSDSMEISISAAIKAVATEWLLLLSPLMNWLSSPRKLHYDCDHIDSPTTTTTTPPKIKQS